MSTLPDDEQYQWNATYHVWSIIKYDYGTKIWGLKEWMPTGWSPSQPYAAQPQSPEAQSGYVGDGENEEGGDRQDNEQAAAQEHVQEQVQLDVGQYQSSHSTSRLGNAHQRSDSGHEYETYQLHTTMSQLAAYPASASSANLRPTFSSHGYGTSYNTVNNQAALAGTWAQSQPQPYSQQQQNLATSPMQAQYAGMSSSAGYRQNFSNHTTLPRGRGQQIQGTYYGPSIPHIENLDPSFRVRNKMFFHEGRVFAVIMNETAGSTTRATDYNTNKSLTTVKYEGNVVYTNVRRFIVVRKRKEFCFACPIFTYSGRATTKSGVNAAAHGIVYTSGGSAQLLYGEHGITKPSLPVVMADQGSVLDKASRVYYGIHHPIQYNVKVKEIGHVPSSLVHVLIQNWREEDEGETDHEPVVVQDAAVSSPIGSNADAGPSTEDTGSGAQDPHVYALTQDIANISVHNDTHAQRPQGGSSRRDSSSKQQSSKYRKKR